MSYWDDAKNVEDYVAMAEGYDGRHLIRQLRGHLPQGASVLELGMGPGVDLELLGEWYVVTGSDASQIFVDRFRETHEGADVMLLDAVAMDTNRRFDCIYSNKVLHHLTRAELESSLARQSEVVTDAGLLLHSFWVGSGTKEHHGMLFSYYDEADLRELVDERFEMVAMGRYTEMADDDSVFVLLRKRPVG